MKNIKITVVIALGTVLVFMSQSRAEMATLEEALTVANNWITLIIHKKGSWGGFETAEVEEIQEFKRGQRFIGYFCRVQPKGYIIISLCKGLTPVKMYSSTCNLDPDSGEGMTDLVKDCMEHILEGVEHLLGPIESVPSLNLRNILEINYQPTWDELVGDFGIFKAGLESGVIEMNYQQGTQLLTSLWHQDDPYNREIPAPPPGDDCTAARCLVGCGPLADSQIMRFWSWPPYGDGSPYNDTYDWQNMPDSLTAGSPAIRIDAVAELCHEVGVAAVEDYCGEGGCQSGNTLLENIDALTNNFRYSNSASREERRLYASTADWFNAIKAQINLNRPVLYEIPGHFIVIDGWQEIGTPSVQEVHVVYGAGGGSDGWYALDYNIPGTDPTWQWEKMAINIVPDQALGTSVSGMYSRDASFPYRYFDQDATGNSASFAAGQNIQFLPGVSVTGISTTGGYIRFVGTSSDNTRLFSIRGTAATATVASVQSYDGGIRLYQNGGIRFH